MQVDDRHVQRNVRRGQSGKLRALARARFEPAPSPVDPEAKAAELRGLGFTEEQIAAHLAHLAQRSAPKEIELWECHESALKVFARCQWMAAVGVSQIIWLGISAGEIRDVADVLGIPCSEELLDDVQTMAAAAAAIRNKAK